MTVYSARGIVAQSLPILAVVTLFQVAAGQVLQAKEETLFAIPVLLALIPAINGLGGNVGSILGARLASGLHLGTISPRVDDEELLGNVAAALVVGVITFTFITVVVRVAAPLLGVPLGLSVPRLFLVVILTGVLLTISLIIISVITALASFRRGLDPDNTVIPVVTGVGDLLGIGWLFLIYGVVA